MFWFLGLLTTSSSHPVCPRDPSTDTKTYQPSAPFRELPFLSPLEFLRLLPERSVLPLGDYGTMTWPPCWPLFSGGRDTDTCPPIGMTSSLPRPQLTFQRHLEVHKPHASPSLGTNNATGIACFSPVAGDFTLTLFPPSEYSQTKLGLTQHTLPSRKRPAKGKVDRKKHFPFSHSTKQ